MSDISPAPEENDKLENILIGIFVLIIFIAIGIFLGWLFLELIKVISHAWHQGAK